MRANHETLTPCEQRQLRRDAYGLFIQLPDSPVKARFIVAEMAKVIDEFWTAAEPAPAAGRTATVTPLRALTSP